jgi:hypothetical protein
MRSPVYEKPTTLIHDVKNDAIPNRCQSIPMETGRKHTEIDEIECECVDSSLEFVDRNSIDRQACEVTCEVSVYNL